ncbi:phage integrase N-terminal SAM-like domain-containing protein [Candidatus Symbiobacter mobilis]|nr:phage integrase N-terminal SAM-like domain-containing protein [Candidatus Symbiobacter mobilis]
MTVEAPAPHTPSPPKLLDQLREKIRLRHYSIRTETQYVHWVKHCILFDNKRHPNLLGAPEVDAYLTHLAVTGNVAASTQNQALSALLFLYRSSAGAGFAFDAGYGARQASCAFASGIDAARGIGCAGSDGGNAWTDEPYKNYWAMPM